MKVSINNKIKIKDKIFLSLWVVYYIYSMLIGEYISRGSMLGIVFNILLFGYILSYVFDRNNNQRDFVLIYVYITYLFVLILLNSSDLYISLQAWVKISGGLLCLPIGYKILSNKATITYFCNILMASVVLFIINILLANTLGWGSNAYTKGDNSFLTGEIFDNGLQLNVCVAALMPFILIMLKKYRLLQVTLVCVALILTIACAKRTPIACLLIAIFLTLALSTYFNEKYGTIKGIVILSKKYIFIAIFGLIGSFFIFEDIIQKQFRARDGAFEVKALGEELRYLEFISVADEIISNNTKYLFFGKETFNTVGTYGDGRFGERMIHQDFSLMLHGTGLIGLIIYVTLLFYLLFAIFTNYRYIDFRRNVFSRKLFTIYIVFWCMYIMTSFSLANRLLHYPAINFLIMGMILRYFDNALKRKNIITAIRYN